MLTNNCPKCSGKMYVDTTDSNEASCINCGHVEYLSSTNKEPQFGTSEGHHTYLDPLRNAKKITPIQIQIDVTKLLQARRAH